MVKDANLQISAGKAEQGGDMSDGMKSEETKELDKMINKIKSAVGVIISLIAQFLWRHGLVSKIDYRKLSLEIHNMLEEKKTSLVIENGGNKTVNCIIAFGDNTLYVKKLIVQTPDLDARFVDHEEEMQNIRCIAEKTAMPSKFDYKKDPLIIMNLNTPNEAEFLFDKLFQKNN